MANNNDTLGKFMQPKSHTPAPIRPMPPPPLSKPAPIPVAPHPPPPLLSVPAVIPTEPAPILSKPDIIPAEPAPPLRIPDVIPLEPAPPLSIPTVIPFEPAPPLRTPDVIPFEPAPPLSTPTVIPFEPPPPLSTPTVVPFEPAPPLSTPAVIPSEPAPPLSVPAVVPFEPAPPLSTPGVIPFEPAPPLSSPTVIPFEKAPPLSTPSVIPFESASFNWRVPQYAYPDPEQHFIQGMTYSEAVCQAELLKNTIPGFAYESKNAVLAAINSINVGINLGGLPGPGGIGINLSTHGARIQAQNFNPFFPNLIGQNAQSGLAGLVQGGVTGLRNAALSYGKQAAQGVLQGAANFASGFLGGAGTGGRISTVIPPWDVAAKDYVFDYNYRARQNAQIIQQMQAVQFDIDRVQNRLIAEKPVLQTSAPAGAQSLTSDKQLQLTFGVVANLTNGNHGERISSTAPTDVQALAVKSKADNLSGFRIDNGNSQDEYVPLVFTDLRKGSGGFRSVYFKPFIKSMSENFAPQWNLQNYFGRVDPVAVYQNTNRTISLSFQIVCMSKEDVKSTYQKLAWLTSMVYPEYKNSMMWAGPVIKMRLGDVFNSLGPDGVSGLPGIITSLDMNYDESIWELDVDSKVPRHINVSIGFHVLHQSPIGIENNPATSVSGFRKMFGEDYIDGATNGRYFGAIQSQEFRNTSSSLPAVPSTNLSLTPTSDQVSAYLNNTNADFNGPLKLELPG